MAKKEGKPKGLDPRVVSSEDQETKDRVQDTMAYAGESLSAIDVIRHGLDDPRIILDKEWDNNRQDLEKLGAFKNINKTWDPKYFADDRPNIYYNPDAYEENGLSEVRLTDTDVDTNYSALLYRGYNELLDSDVKMSQSTRDELEARIKNIDRVRKYREEESEREVG